MSDRDKLVRTVIEAHGEAVTEPRAASGPTMPACPKCGGELCFASAGAGDVQWWRCTGCNDFYPARSAQCAHAPNADSRCAICGGSQIAITTTIRQQGSETTIHFCSMAHLRRFTEGDD